MVDETRVLRLIRSVADDIAVLQAESNADDERRADPMWLRGIKYAFVTAIEACVDVAQHLCSSEGWGPPADNGDTMTILGKQGVLEAGLAARMRQAVGFRNVLVHEYVTVDDAIVTSRLADLSDLNAFAAQVVSYLDTPSTPGRDA